MAAHRPPLRRRAGDRVTRSLIAACCAGALAGCGSRATSEPIGEKSPLEGIPAAPLGASGVRFGPPAPELMPPGVPGFDPEEWGEAEPPPFQEEGESLEPSAPEGDDGEPELPPRDPFSPPPPDPPLAPNPPQGIDL